MPAHAPVACDRPFDEAICYQQFLNNRTVTYHGSQTFRVKTNYKSPEKAIPDPVLVEGAHVVSRFTVTGARPQLLYVTFPGPAVDGGPFVSEMALLDGKNLLQLTNFGRSDTFWFGGFIARGQAFFGASANPPPGRKNPGGICQLFSIDTLGAHLRQLTRLPSDGRPVNGCSGRPVIPGLPPPGLVDLQLGHPRDTGCAISEFFLDPTTGTVLFASSCDPVGANAFGEQLFGMRPDGTGLRQLTNARGMTTDPDGTIHVELPGPFAYTSRSGG